MRSLRTITRNYDLLTPEERLGLIIAAGVREDDAEQRRLVQMAKSIGLAMADYEPFAYSFRDLSMLTFIELVEEAIRYRDAWHQVVNSLDPVDEKEGADSDGGTPDDDQVDDLSDWERSFNLALAAGYVLKAKADGWKLFCERLRIPPFVLMENLPGFARLERSLAQTDEATLAPEGFRRWLNRIRPAGEPELIEIPLTAEGMAAEAEVFFRKEAQRWGG